MREIGRMRARLSASGDLAGAFAAVRDAFTVIQALADAHAGRRRDMFAAFMFAGAYAAEGREAVGIAPSMPAGSGPPARLGQPGAEDVYEVADDLAGLAAALGVQLAAMDNQAGNLGDRQACRHAAGLAGRIRDLLAPDS